MEGTLNQPYILAATMYAGMIAGVVYSVFAVFRRLLSGGKLFLIAADILFVLVLFILAGLTLYAATQMKVRFYHYIGMAIGFALYHFAIAPLARTACRLVSGRKKKPTQGVDNPAKKSSNIDK